ncbi:hypothetical protein BN59_02650 [Legionella massiliensis]|uniref:Uncharacterized protein n=2 Tax=Legionella massiliensis TaxID=1034943 RepID=A0A078KV76_9GAMM|nr:hypothetical protein BN59_02650 [Legionella massiliensis]CEE14078.1 hypothetical protein BN1094_02650 [Legionella massiliensis]
MLARFWKILYVSATLILLSNCKTIGPAVLPQDRYAFNAAMLQSEEQQILINLVRMQYGDRPYFLTVDNITSNTVLNVSSGGSNYNYTAERTNAVGLITKTFTNSVGVTSPSASLTESPTIIYSPLQGDKFTTQMLTPIQLKNVYLLVRSGWSLARVLRITTEELGKFQNAMNASRPTSSHVPEYKPFVKMIHYARMLHLENKIKVRAELINNNFCLSFVFLRKYRHTAQVNKLFSMLWPHENTQHINKIIISEKPLPHNSKYKTLVIVTRPYIGLLYYLAKSVQVTPDDIASGRVLQIKTKDGKPFDWGKVTHGILTVYISNHRPANANVVVYYRNHWYYIADNDRDSKETFALIQQLFSLQAGDITKTSPLITVNV